MKRKRTSEHTRATKKAKVKDNNKNKNKKKKEVIIHKPIKCAEFFDDEDQHELFMYPTETKKVFNAHVKLFGILRYMRGYNIDLNLVNMKEFDFYKYIIPAERLKVFKGFVNVPSYTKITEAYTKYLTFKCKDKNQDFVYIKYVPMAKEENLGYVWKERVSFKYNPLRDVTTRRGILNSLSNPRVSRIIFLLNNNGIPCSSESVRRTVMLCSSTAIKKFYWEIDLINLERKKNMTKELTCEIFTLDDVLGFYGLYKKIKNYNSFLCTKDGIQKDHEPIIKKYGALKRLPKIYLDDPLTKLFGAKFGDVLKHSVSSLSAGLKSTYRFVCDEYKERKAIKK